MDINNSIFYYYRIVRDIDGNKVVIPLPKKMIDDIKDIVDELRDDDDEYKKIGSWFDENDIDDIYKKIKEIMIDFIKEKPFGGKLIRWVKDEILNDLSID